MKNTPTSLPWHLKFLGLDCAVPDCDKTATMVVRISINNLGKKRLAVCKCHGDAAKEDRKP
jgi:hypothetical protein